MRVDANKSDNIRKGICDSIKSYLVSRKHKTQFENYLATGNIDKDIAIELYDNILYNLQIRITKIISWTAAIIVFIISLEWERTNFLFILIVFTLAWFVSTISTYYPFRILINTIYPKEYKNGSNKNYLLKMYTSFNNKKSSKIKEYIPQAPVLMKIGKNGIWSCVKCNKLNFKSKKVCFKCNYEKNWECMKCYRLNISDNQSCIRCNVKKDHSENLKMHWKCNGCNEEHQNTFTHCWNCSKEKEKQKET